MNALRTLRMAAGSVMDELEALGYVELPHQLRVAIDGTDPHAVVISPALAWDIRTYLRAARTLLTGAELDHLNSVLAQLEQAQTEAKP